jgi:hypothetical protein
MHKSRAQAVKMQSAPLMIYVADIAQAAVELALPNRTKTCYNVRKINPPNTKAGGSEYGQYRF